MRRNGARSRRAGRLERWDAEQTAWARPQWSPLSTSGATCQERYRERDGQAAMEPALDERGDVKPVSAATSSRVPQWSPLSTSGATDHVPAKVDLTNDAAMEPALDERGDSDSLCQAFPGDLAAMEPALDERGDPNGRRRR